MYAFDKLAKIGFLASIFLCLATFFPERLVLGQIQSSDNDLVSFEEASLAASRWGQFKGIDNNVRQVLEVSPAPGEFAEVAWIVELVGGGYAIVPKEKLLLPVYLYSRTEIFNKEYGGLSVILQEIKKRGDAIHDLAIAEVAGIAEERNRIWNDVMQKNIVLAAPDILGPLCSSEWGQGWPFNAQCPIWDGRRCVAGCIATAMAQVMYYWRHPIMGEGENSYYTHTHGFYMSADFGATTYDWENMPDDPFNPSEEEINALSTLSLHCGISVYMDYDPDGSEADPDRINNAYIFNFRYWPDAHHQERNIDYILEELEFLRPVLLGAHNNAGDGHRWVVDGYNYSGSDILLHMNMGWDGYQDNWYTVDDVPEGLTIDQNQVFRVAPENVFFLSGTGNDNEGSPGHPYRNLDVAISNIPSNSTLIVRSGTNHPGSYIIDKAMTIRGIDIVIGN